MSESSALSHTPRVRCKYCSKRIPASAVVCPNCQRNPRAFYWKRGQILLFVLFLLLVLGGVISFFSGDLQSLAPVQLALFPTPTRSPSRPPITVILVATARPSLPPTRVPATSKPANTVTPTRPTLTPTASFTPTRIPRAPGTTDTPSPIPTRAPVPAPKLLSPGDGERVSGSNKHVLLRFQSVRPLNAQEWFRIQVDYLDRAGNPSGWCEFSKVGDQEFPREIFDDSSPNVRSFLWRVSVVHSTQVSPQTCDAPYETLSSSSEVWTFYWY